MTDAPNRTRKPLRLWALQAIATLQIAAAVVRGIPAVKAIRAHLFQAAGLWWMLQTLLVVATCIVLVLGLERAFRRSDLVAPAAGFVWWSCGLIGAIRSLGEPPPSDLKGLMFENVDPASEIAALVIVHGLLFWLVGSMVWHRKSRAYLREAAAPSVSE